MTNEVLMRGITLGQFNSLQALAGLDGCWRLTVPWEVASELDQEVPLLYLMHFIRASVGGNPSKYEDSPYSRLLDYVEDLFNEECGL